MGILGNPARAARRVHWIAEKARRTKLTPEEVIVLCRAADDLKSGAAVGGRSFRDAEVAAREWSDRFGPDLEYQH